MPPDYFNLDNIAKTTEKNLKVKYFEKMSKFYSNFIEIGNKLAWFR